MTQHYSSCYVRLGLNVPFPGQNFPYGFKVNILQSPVDYQA